MRPRTAALPLLLALVAAPGRAGESWVRYQAAADATGPISVEATFPAGTPDPLTVDGTAVPYVREVEVLEGGRWRPVVGQRGGWRVPGCQREGCRVRYRFALAEAARTLDDPDLAADRGGVLIAPTSTWLLRPERPLAGTRLSLSVRTAEPWSFVSGWHRAGDGSYQAALGEDLQTPYAALGPLDRQRFAVGGGTVEVALASELSPATAVLAWLRRSAEAIAAYYGKLPVDRLLIVVLPPRARLQGKQLGGGGASILLAPGDDPAHSEDDWVATHEMVHVATPALGRRHLWLTEGLATYVEPIARVRTGDLRPEKVWADMLHGMPKGLAHERDRGMDGTADWGRLYWGGALFWLLADLEIREQSHNRLSLRDSLRAVLAAGGNTEQAWPIERFLAEADRPLRHPVLGPLYQRMGKEPPAVDLAALWKRLGVSLGPLGAVFDDRAPLAAIRREITGR